MLTLDPIRILFEDPHLIAVNKPAPLLTQAPEGIPSLENLVKAYIKAKHAKPAGVYLGVPHRLDRPVSGAIVFARSTKAAQRVHAQFESHSIQKVYWACVRGTVAPVTGSRATNVVLVSQTNRTGDHHLAGRGNASQTGDAST